MLPNSFEYKNYFFLHTDQCSEATPSAQAIPQSTCGAIHYHPAFDTMYSGWQVPSTAQKKSMCTCYKHPGGPLISSVWLAGWMAKQEWAAFGTEQRWWGMSKSLLCCSCLTLETKADCSPSLSQSKTAVQLTLSEDHLLFQQESAVQCKWVITALLEQLTEPVRCCLSASAQERMCSAFATNRLCRVRIAGS